MGLKTVIGDGVVVGSWYDRTSRNWVTQILDGKGFDLPMSRDAYGVRGDHRSDYNGNKFDMKLAHDAAVSFALKEYGEGGKGADGLEKLYEKALVASVSQKVVKKR
jgi:hypothetical protein